MAFTMGVTVQPPHRAAVTRDPSLFLTTAAGHLHDKVFKKAMHFLLVQAFTAADI